MTREHLFHGDVAKAIAGDPSLTTAQARLRLPEEYRRESTHPAMPAMDTHDPRNRVIKGLLCPECNAGWAQELESQAGRHVRAFIDAGAGLERALMQRWIAFLGMKLLTYGRPGRELHSGPLFDVLRHLTRDEALGPGTMNHLFVGRLPSPMDRWAFQWCVEANENLNGRAMRFLTATRGVAWLVRVSDEGRAPTWFEGSFSEGREGLRLDDVSELDEVVPMYLGLHTGRPFGFHLDFVPSQREPGFYDVDPRSR